MGPHRAVMDGDGASRTQGSGFRHEALIYSGAEELLAGTLPFLQEGTEAGEAMLVAMPAPSLALVRGELDGASEREASERIRFVDMETLGRNPARIISAWRDFVGPHLQRGAGVRGIGEPIWLGRSSAELDECMRHESLLNLAFADSRAWNLLCPYDARLADDVLASAEHNHPFLCGMDMPAESATFEHGSRDVFDGRLPAHGHVLAELDFTAAQLAEVRGRVAAEALGAGLNPERAENLVLCVSEVASNSVTHGGGAGTLRIWRERETLGFDVRDRGRFADPLAGRARAARGALHGRGLWIANELCDLLQIRSTPEGSIVRVHMHADASPA